MTLQLNYWKHPSGSNKDRIYVAGLSLQGRTYLYRIHGGLIRLGGDHVPSGSSSFLLDEVLDTLGLDASPQDPGLWDALLGLCSTAGGRGRHQPTHSLGTNHSDTEGMDIATIKVPCPITIQVDHREPASVIDQLNRAVNTKIEVCQLPLGDYVINEHLYIERKTLSDFEASIIDSKRLFDQSERIKMEPDAIGVVLLEGDWTQATRMLPQQVIGAMSFLGAIQGMSVWQSTGPACSAYTIVKLATHFCNGLGYELGLRQHKPQSLLDAQSYVLEGCPGINAALARRLLQHFGSVAAVASASVAELRRVEGIGPKKADRMAQVLRASYTV